MGICFYEGDRDDRNKILSKEELNRKRIWSTWQQVTFEHEKKNEMDY